MKTLYLLTSILLCATLRAQNYENEPSEKYPFGKPHPDAPKEIADYEPMIGECDCRSVSRIDQNTWADTVRMKWTFKYIMNGWGVQDLTLKEDGSHGGSLRMYNADSARWYVHYYNTKKFSSPLLTWEGNSADEKIILYRDSPAPNGTPGDYRITFTDFSENGYNWVGEWVTKNESIVYPTWRIFCQRTRP